jgi:hypothetical protein
VVEPPALDTKPYVEPDPIIGYRYTPGTRMTLGKPGGGRYALAINADGVRSDRDYAFAKPPGVFRIIVCGDSMAGGQFVSNSQRFSELLERRIPNLEVINLALEGSGTDQQVLLYEHVGLRYEHDLVVLLPFLQNIRRNLVGAREAIEPGTGRTVLRPKPRFELTDRGLVLHPPGEHGGVPPSGSPDVPPRTRIKSVLNGLPGAQVVKRLAYRLRPWEPFPEYRDPEGPAWQLMAALIGRMQALASPRPLVIVPTFYAGYLQFRMARNYWDRFASLHHPPAAYALDVLPHFQREGEDAARSFQEPHDMHFSAHGHLVLADALQAELTSLGLLPHAVAAR